MYTGRIFTFFRKREGREEGGKWEEGGGGRKVGGRGKEGASSPKMVVSRVSIFLEKRKFRTKWSI